MPPLPNEPADGVRSDLDCRRDGAVLTVTFDRSDRLNAFRAASVQELRAVLADAAGDESVRAVIFTGRGRAFSAGQDLAELEESVQDGILADAPERVAQLQALAAQMLSHPKVLIAAVNGIAVGLGAEIAIACDIRIAGRSARIGFVEVTRGLFETNGVMWLLPRLVGLGHAADLMLSGDIVDAETAARIGLVSRLVDDDDLMGEALTLAHRIAGNAPIPVGLVKELLGRTWERTFDETLAAETTGVLRCLASDDLREGTQAFLEKRAPRYRGV